MANPDQMVWRLVLTAGIDQHDAVVEREILIGAMRGAVGHQHIELRQCADSGRLYPAKLAAVGHQNSALR